MLRRQEGLLLAREPRRTGLGLALLVVAMILLSLWTRGVDTIPDPTCELWRLPGAGHLVYDHYILVLGGVA